ncbi:MAG: hypothetical protein P1S60_20040, partial [Anaerolineae bacterium]|nr:hypothetical protein [Anaerolineae bacterium]
ILADVNAGVFRKSTAEDHITAGNLLAADVLTTLESPGDVLDLLLMARTGWAPALRDRNKILPLTDWQAMAKQQDELTRNVGQYWTGRITQGPPLAAGSPIEVGVVRLDHRHAVAWISAEAVAEWLPIMRACNSEMAVIAWGYCQFVPTYLPTDALLDEGGYEVDQANRYEMNGPGPFASGLDRAFANVFRDLLS